MKVSVITVCYQACEFIDRTLDSVLKQAYPEIEYIVIDGGSTDGTLDRINRVRHKLHGFVSEPDEGIYHAMNKGIRMSKGDVLCFLNAGDVFYSSNIVEYVAGRFEEYQEMDLLFGSVIVSDELTKRASPKTHEGITKDFLYRNTICHQAQFIRKSAFERVGLYDETYQLLADLEWFLRAMSQHRIRLKRTRQIVSVYVLGGRSSEEGALHAKERSEIQREYFTTWERSLIWCYKRLHGVEQAILRGFIPGHKVADEVID